MTGRYQQRFGHEFNPFYDPTDATEGLPLTERLLPQFMKDGGYATGWVGKWHLGASPGHEPWLRGFDETFGFIGGGHKYLNWKPGKAEYVVPLTRNGKPLEQVPEHLTAALGDEASAFIRRHPTDPWFLYLAFNAPHTPLEPTEERMKRFESIEDATRRKRVAQMSLLDDAVGNVLASLADTKQAERTLVFFFSDNGGPVKPAGADNTPLRGQKGEVYDGGIHVPFVVAWPGKLPAGATYDQPVISLDVFATALALAAVPMPTDRKYDGVNLIPFLAGENKSAPHERLFWRTGGGKSFAVRQGNWKLVRNEKQKPELYDLGADLAETKDLSADRLDVAAQLTDALDAWNKELIPPVFKGLGARTQGVLPAVKPEK
jgi:arylsulfatase A-like enzyme